jgi:choline kinase
MRAIILAAGLSSRLAKVTNGGAKCLLQISGRSILDRQLDCLETVGCRSVTVVTGHDARNVQSAVGKRAAVEYFNDFRHTNNLHTLYHVRHLLDDAAFVIFSDVLVPAEAYLRLGGSKENMVLLTDASSRLPGTMRVSVRDGHVVDLGSHISPEMSSGNFTGVAFFSDDGSALLSAELARCVKDDESKGWYYTAAVRALAARGFHVAAEDIKPLRWIEVDTEEDYRRAQELASTGLLEG